MADTQQRSQVAPIGRAHARDRTRARAAPEAEQDGLGLVVEGVPQQQAGAEGRRSGVEGGVASRAGCGLRAAVGAHRDAQCLHWVQAQLVTDRGDPRGVLGRTGLQAVIDDDQTGLKPEPRCFEGGRCGQREGVSTAGAGDEDRPVRCGQRGADGAAHLGERRMRPHQPPPSRGSGVDAGDPAPRLGDLGLGRQRLA